jgi:hypothetical protein
VSEIDVELVYCTYCGKTHAVRPGEKECAPGAWQDASKVWTVPEDGLYEVKLGNGKPPLSVLAAERGRSAWGAWMRLFEYVAENVVLAVAAAVTYFLIGLLAGYLLWA